MRLLFSIPPSKGQDDLEAGAWPSCSALPCCMNHEPFSGGIEMPIPSLKPKMSTWLDQTNNHFHGQASQYIQDRSNIISIPVEPNKTKPSNRSDFLETLVSSSHSKSRSRYETFAKDPSQPMPLQEVYLRFRNIMHASALLNPTTGTKER